MYLPNHLPSSYKLFRILILFLFIVSMYPWFTWGVDSKLIWTLAVPILTAFRLLNRQYFDQYSVNKFAALFTFVLIMWMQRQTLMAAVFGIGLWWSIYIFLQLKEQYKKDIVEYITKWFGLLLGVSLVYFVISKAGVPLPHNTIVFNTSSSYDTFNNYYLYVQPAYADSFRFSGIFLEPGHMTMGLAPLIYLNKYNVKNRYCLMLLAAQLFSFSLAGYLLLFFGFIWQNMTEKNNIHKVRSLILSFFAFSVFLFLSASLFGEDLFSSLILDRLQVENGSIVGNDRMNDYFASVFSSYVASSDFLFGMGDFDAEGFFQGHGNSGWQVYAYMYGLIGLIAAGLSYISPYIKQHNASTLGFCILLILILMGNGYPTWWCMLIHLTIGATVLSNNIEV